MTDQGPSNTSPANDTQDVRRRAGAPTWFTVAAGALLVATFAVIMILLLRDNGEVVTADESTTTSVLETTTSADSVTSTTEATTITTDSTTTTTDSTTTTTDATTTTPPSTIPPEYSTAVWPWFNSPVRYDDPVEAAAGFARDFLGFSEPVVGEFQQGDSRSGEVMIQPIADGPVTTVLVRQLGVDDRWWILGAATANIVAETPQALCEVVSPLTVSGEALAFEGNVEVLLRVDEVEEPVAKTNVTGGGSEMAPFTGELTFVEPVSDSGAIVLLSRSAKDGSVWEASAFRVSFGGGGC